MVILGDFNIRLEDSFEPIVMRFLDLLIILTVPTGQKDHPPLRWVEFFDSGLGFNHRSRPTRTICEQAFLKSR